MRDLARRFWPDALVVVGAMLLAYSCSAYSGSGNVSGDVRDGTGEVSGDISINYSDDERMQIVVFTGAVAIGVIAKLNRR